MTPQQPAASETSRTAAPPENLLALLLERAKEPTRVASRHKVRGQWRETTWFEILERVRRLSAGLTKLGIQPGDRVCIFASTSFDWALANLAIFGAGAITVPIYASNTAREAQYILANCGARAVFVDHDQPEGRLPGRGTRVEEIRANLPELAHVIGFELLTRAEDHILSLADLESQGTAASRAAPGALEEMAARIAADDNAYILYTSGTTGQPKGVMLTHANWASQAHSINAVDIINRDDTLLLFLPLAHSFGLVAIAAWLGVGMVLAFAESIERAVDNCAEVQATVMTAVPRVFEKAFNKVIADGSSQPGLKGVLFTWAMGQFDAYAAARAAGRDTTSLQWTAARRLVFSKVEERLKARFGGRMRVFVSGGAPLSAKIATFFEVCGLVICEGYGLTETAAPTHVNLPRRIKIGTVGLPFPGLQVRLAEDGEILVKGPQVMKGYYGMPEETAAVLDPEGWLHTGDIGEVDPDNFLRITDRKKDLIKTSGGKYIAPQELENALKTEPMVSQVMIHGDRRKFVSALFTVNEEYARKWAKDANVPYAHYAELTQRPEVRARIKAAVDALNANLASYATIKQFVVLDHDWTVETGELTPSLKIKRKMLTEKYAPVLDKLYELPR